MIKLSIQQTEISCSNRIKLVVGNTNSLSIQYTFSPEWDGLVREAVFTNGDTSITISLSSEICVIPWEVLSSPGELFVSVRGIGENGNFVLCTENLSLGTVSGSNASAPAEYAEEATPNVIDTLLADVAELQSIIESGIGGGSGEAGADGADGKSAYEIACDNGFEGNEVQWLASLRGTDGQNGADGIDGTNGADGYTPVKGVDYFTAADKSAIVQDVVSALPVYNGEVI